jgi:hypothetical protein
MLSPCLDLFDSQLPFLPDDDGYVAAVCSWCEDGASTSFVRISCGDDHTAAVTRDGQVILAGDNDFGELGKVSLLPRNRLHFLSAFMSHRFVSLFRKTVPFVPVCLSLFFLSPRLDYSLSAFVALFYPCRGVVLTRVCRGIISRATCQHQFRPFLRGTGG